PVDHCHRPRIVPAPPGRAPGLLRVVRLALLRRDVLGRDPAHAPLSGTPAGIPRAIRHRFTDNTAQGRVRGGLLRNAAPSRLRAALWLGLVTDAVARDGDGRGSGQRAMARDAAAAGGNDHGPARRLAPEDDVSATDRHAYEHSVRAGPVMGRGRAS